MPVSSSSCSRGAKSYREALKDRRTLRVPESGPVDRVAVVLQDALDLSVLDIFDGVREFFVRVWNMGFAAVERFASYFLLGAAIVVPAFLIVSLNTKTPVETFLTE